MNIMNIVYVLVSNEKDTYLHQTYLSILSLRKVMPDAQVTIVCDSETEQSLIGERSKIYKLGVTIKSVVVPIEYNMMKKSRFIKTNLVHYMESDYLYIDGDTIVCEDLSDIDTTPMIACVLDCHVKISEHPLESRIRRNAEKFGFRPGMDDKHFNTGVMWVKKCDETDKFFTEWQELWEYTMERGLALDQVSFNELNCRHNGMISELQGKWNCHIRRYGQGFNYLHNSKIIHYFASNAEGTVPYVIGDNSILRTAMTETPDSRIIRTLDCPRAAIKAEYVVASTVFRDVIESDSVTILLDLKKNHPGLYSAHEWFAKNINRVKRKLRSLHKAV